jgi:multiple sugar transport system substrate-binding protein
MKLVPHCCRLIPCWCLDDTLQIEDFYPILVAPYLVDGQLWGIPVGGSAPYMEYNRQLFEEAGIALPVVRLDLR